jgi:hypothetical protein
MISAAVAALGRLFLLAVAGLVGAAAMSTGVLVSSAVVGGVSKCLAFVTLPRTVLSVVLDWLPGKVKIEKFISEEFFFGLRGGTFAADAAGLLLMQRAGHPGGRHVQDLC